MVTRNGTPGNDILTGTQEADSIFGFAGNDTLLGLGGEDSLNGGTGNDSLNGGTGFDALNGGIGDDTLDGGADTDEMSGGTGNDTYIINSIPFPSGSEIFEDTNSGTDTVQSAFSYVLEDNLENLALMGTGATSGTGNSLNNIIAGNAANNDIFGGAGNDTLNGGAGNDTLNGGAGNDTLNGGAGNDTYVISDESGTDSITEAINSGTDTVRSFVSYTLGSNLENLMLQDGVAGTGNSLNNIIVGNAANNNIFGRAGNDTLNGGAGNDLLNGGAGNDIFFGNSGLVSERDTLTGGAGIDKFFIGNANEVFYDDRNTTTAGRGDYALITGFNSSEDIIKLNGRKTDYFLTKSPTGLPPGTAIYRNKPSGETDELISIVQGNSHLNLNSNYFSFTGASSLNLSDLNGNNGFVLKGIDAGDGSGVSVSEAGDVNGDGFDDLIIGAPSANLTYSNYGDQPAGESYVVFGQAGGFDANFELSSLQGSNGFAIEGVVTAVGSGFGSSVSSAGDINGDGFDDLIVGAPSTGYAGAIGFAVGKSYVVFGKDGGFNASLSVYDINGSNGFVINRGFSYSGQRLGTSVSSAGDINGDGFDDLLIGAPGSYNTYYGNTNGSGRSYVVFGRAEGFDANLELSDPNSSNGFTIVGIDARDYSGRSVSTVGDVNGDGFLDIIIGATSTSPDLQNTPGESYVVFGQAGGFGDNLNLSQLNGSNGFVINGIDAGDSSGISVSDAGDVNGDGFDDLIIGANSADLNSQNSAGESYVVFGKAGGFGASLNLSALNGRNGFVINGIDAYDSLGGSVSSAGDFNGDGFDDLLVGASGADPNSQDSAGESYVVFGKTGGFSASFNLFNLNSSNGIVLNGIDAGDSSGGSVSEAGDFNGDGFSDLIIGASGADSNGQSDAGESYVIFGRDFNNRVTHAGTTGNDTLTGTNGNDILVGGLGNDRFISNRGSDVLYGGAGNDIISFNPIARRINGGSGTDTLHLDTSGINLDLTTISSNKISGIEKIDITGTGNNSLKFNRLDVLDLSDTTNRVIVNGNTGDTVTSMRQGWIESSTITLNSILYDRYTVGAATVLVDADITQTIT